MENLFVQIPAELKRRIVQAADAEGERLNEFVARVCANAIGAPKLGKIPEGRRPGRKPKQLQPA